MALLALPHPRPAAHARADRANGSAGQAAVTATAYRVFYRNRTEEVVWGEAALQQRLARKTPGAIHHEVALIHICGVCGATGPWVDGWVQVPGLVDGRGNWDARVMACSDLCMHQHNPAYKRPTWSGACSEPRGEVPQAMREALWAANRAEKARKDDLRAHRTVPMFHEGKGDGWCRWCGTPVPKPRRTWHKDCLRHYLQHSDMQAQYNHLAKTRGRGCAVEGCASDGAEVDHVVALWKVRALPDRERRPYYGPANLQLLCHRHHKQKSATEAAYRAAINRGDAVLEYGEPGHGAPAIT